jgi:hypothetical protein
MSDGRAADLSPYCHTLSRVQACNLYYGWLRSMSAPT